MCFKLVLSQNTQGVTANSTEKTKFNLIVVQMKPTAKFTGSGAVESCMYRVQSAVQVATVVRVTSVYTRICAVEKYDNVLLAIDVWTHARTHTHTQMNRNWQYEYTCI